MRKLKHTPGPWIINHWSKCASGVSCIEQGDVISYFTGSAVEAPYYGIRAKLDPLKHYLPGSFEGAHITNIDDYKSQDGGIESLANAKLIAAAPDLLNCLIKFTTACEKGNPIELFEEFGKINKEALEVIKKATE